MRASVGHYEDPVAERIGTYAREQGLSLRELSRRAGLSESTAQKVCDRLETKAGDVGVATLTALAKAMGQELRWLLYGDAPPSGFELRSFEEWDRAAAEAVDRFGLDPAQTSAVGLWTVHEKPARLDAFFVAQLVRSHRGG